MAHCPIGSVWASYAGSARPFADPSAMISAISMFWPPVPAPGAAVAAAVCLSDLSKPSGTPNIALPYVAVLSPVRTSLAVEIFALFSFRNLSNLAA